jgi:hypothetical protein
VKQEEKNKHQQTKNKTKKYLENPELDELRAISPHVSNYNGTNCRFLTWGKTKKKEDYNIKHHLLPTLRLRLQRRHNTNSWLRFGFAMRRKFERYKQLDPFKNKRKKEIRPSRTIKRPQ